MSSMRTSPKSPTLALSIVMLVVIAGVVVISSFIGGRFYVVASFIVIACAMVPFFVGFERGRHTARRLALVAAMCALTVASRVVFVWVPFFKPMAALVMISGIAFGRNPGFLIGALSMLASNLLFGQGPWSPWQMLSFGLCGYVFGALGEARVFPKEGLAPRRRVALAVAGLVFVIVVAGPVLDTSSLFFIISKITVESALAVYAAGFIPNCLLGVATAITLLLVAQPLLKMIRRLSIKYGLDDESSANESSIL